MFGLNVRSNEGRWSSVTAASACIPKRLQCEYNARLLLDEVCEVRTNVQRYDVCTNLYVLEKELRTPFVHNKATAKHSNEAIIASAKYAKLRWKPYSAVPISLVHSYGSKPSPVIIDKSNQWHSFSRPSWLNMPRLLFKLLNPTLLGKAGNRAFAPHNEVQVWASELSIRNANYALRASHTHYMRKLRLIGQLILLTVRSCSYCPSHQARFSHVFCRLLKRAD